MIKNEMERMMKSLAILTKGATSHLDCEAPLQPHHILIITSLHYWDCREPPLPIPHHLHHCHTHPHHHLGGIARHHGQPHHRAACACVGRHHQDQFPVGELQTVAHLGSHKPGTVGGSRVHGGEVGDQVIFGETRCYPRGVEVPAVRHRHHETENGVRGPNPTTQYAGNPASCLLLFENGELNK